MNDQELTPWERIVGQDQPRATLSSMLERERIPHAMLFEGPEGVGKATVARAFAAALVCERPAPLACGSCAGCRQVAAGGHPDLLTITRQPKKDVPARRAAAAEEADLQKDITVDQIRDLARLAAQAPRLGRRRLFIIDPADRMNLNAQNALLKTLEEPPARSVLILVAARPRLLLPTVRSRCFVLPFAALRTGDLTAALVERGLPQPEAAARAALAAGRPGRAIELDLEELRERRDEVLGMLESLVDGRLDQLAGFAAAIAGKDDQHLREHLELVEELVRDAARTAVASEPGHADVVDRLERLGDRIGHERAARLVTGIERLRAQSRINLNRTLVAETVLAAVAGGPLP